MIEANLIHGAHEAGVQKLLFLGSTCIDPKLAPQPMNLERAVDRFGVYVTACACSDSGGLRASPAGWTLLRPPGHTPRGAQLRYNSLE